MNEKAKQLRMIVIIPLILTSILIFSSCAPRPSVGELQSESQSVELGDASSVRVNISFGAGELAVSGGAESLLEADFRYNVARLKPEVEYSDGVLTVTQPDGGGIPVLRDISGFRNEWDLRLYDNVPIDLRVDMGAGTSLMQLAGLTLTRLDVSLGAGESTVDLTGDWANDLNISIDTGAGDVRVRLPSNVGVRVETDTGLGNVETLGFNKDGNVYTNDAYGESEVTLQVDVQTGLGRVDLEVVNESAGSSGN